MRFENALELMRQGKKVRILDWSEGSHIYLDRDNYIRGSGNRILFMIDGVLAYYLDSKWEVYEEQKQEPEKQKACYCHCAKCIC